MWIDSIRYQIAHSDPRTCPVNLSPGQPASSGALVYDLRGDWPTAPRSWLLEVGVYDDEINFDHSCQFALGGPSTELFSWGPAYPGSSDPYSWQASQWVNFNASYNPDYLCVKVDLSGVVSFDEPRANITMNYFGTQALRSGPNTGVDESR